MSCRELVDFLMDYLDGLLPEDVRSQFVEHLAECPDCVAFLNTYRTSRDLARGLADDVAEMPEDLVTAILAACPRVAT